MKFRVLASFRIYGSLEPRERLSEPMSRDEAVELCATFFDYGATSGLIVPESFRQETTRPVSPSRDFGTYYRDSAVDYLTAKTSPENLGGW